MSFLSAVGKDFKAVFSWLGSSKGQQVIASTEGLAIASATVFGDGAIVQAGITLVNSWLEKIITTETVAAAAGDQTGSSDQKVAAVLSAISPQLAQYFPATTAAQAKIINDALVLVLNTLGEATAPTAAPTA